MKKGLSIIGVFLFLLVLPFISVSAEAKEVGTFEELKEAIANDKIDSITLKNNIETTEKLNVTHKLTIDGANHTLTYTGKFKDNAETNTTWDGVYVLQVYNTTATVKNISLTGGNAALLVNGSTVTLEGAITVSGNGFGGIELGKGTGVTTEPKLVLKEGAVLTNGDEDKDNNPTVWVDGTKATITVNGVSKEFDASSTQVKLTIAEVEDIAPEVKVETSKDSNVTITDEDVTDIFDESLKADDTLKDLLESEGDVTVELVAKDATASEEETKKFEEALTDGTIAGYVDIVINVTKNGGEVKHLTELTKAIDLAVQLPEMPELEDGYERSYYILREHDGKVEKIEATLSEDGKSLLFSSDKFSKYAVVYVDTKVAEDEEEAPETLDAGLTYVGLAVLSLGAAIISVKKLRNN